MNNEKTQKLTPCEIKIAQLMIELGRDKLIARALDIEERTVRKRICTAIKKTGASGRAQLAVMVSQMEDA